MQSRSKYSLVQFSIRLKGCRMLQSISSARRRKYARVGACVEEAELLRTNKVWLTL
ncbi:hypothetical protein ECL_A063 (plasmid) [Enterobacter cloacae subsp. cloacae ATCC 13047]|uniref:Uncharacterized protein n=1 Tax=Enterobacter cloacae subsp. cloacae (strain ATCC 13047 / DSM 30054 / NBRC 13535 / NCTC 10005 / WDCM 00083 / NCDC 279-56) TaxID=716541 RepID=A0A0H3CRZ9_ENTCC|nr:hypothetical protein ECL_A063 [Enterobacter cloacae subsp. cloacae ATCC 13047]AQT91586.1 hypothetical protein B1H21_23825 [Enterobacter roggenkampii]OOC77948.1 hypothetical protein BWP06_25850 [Enterobacter cloacae]